ncbi:hypothetical protein SLS61_004820 [Didymella pomorum]
MPHAVQDIEVSHPQKKVPQRPKNRALPRELLQLTNRLFDLQELYAHSQLSQSISRQLHSISKSGQPITRIVSLGLGSLLVTKGQSRRLKQLAILLAIRDQLQVARRESIEVYAQDPTFTRPDEVLLASFGIQILRTSSGSDLGEAASVISPTTLVYSPFLTLEAYELLFSGTAVPMQYMLGDDFDALLQKWPKRSAERTQVEGLLKHGLARYRRKAVAGEGFWTAEDETFASAVYVVADKAPVRAKM